MKVYSASNSRELIKEALKEVVCRELDVDLSALRQNTHLVNALGMDSLARVGLTLGLEDEFGVVLDDDAVAKAARLDDWVDLLVAQIDQ